MITRAVGHRDYVQVDTFLEEAARRDRYLLCTDGLHGYINEDAELLDLLTSKTIDEVARRSVDFANQRGGRDNITALVVEIAG